MQGLEKQVRREVVFTLFLVVTLVLGLWLLFLIRHVLLLWFVSFILMTALYPLVEKLTRWRVSRGLAVGLTMLIILALVVLVMAVIMPPLISQSTHLVIFLSNQLRHSDFFSLDLSSFTPQLETLSRGALNIMKLVVEAGSNLLGVVSVVVLTVYLLLERGNFEQGLKKYLGLKRGGEIYTVLAEIEMRVGGWVRAELMLMVLVGTTVGIGLSILGVPFALPLALLAGLMELVPTIGPIISAVPAVASGLTVSWLTGLVGVISLFLLVHQSESHVIVPMVMKHTTGLHPLITLAVLMVGGILGGVAGAVLAVPLFITLRVVLTYLSHQHQWWRDVGVE